MKTLNHLFKVLLVLLASRQFASAQSVFISVQQYLASTSLQSGACINNNIVLQPGSSNTSGAAVYFTYDASYVLYNTSTNASYNLTYCTSTKSLRGSFWDPSVTGSMSINSSSMDAPASLKVPSCVPSGTYELRFTMSNIQSSHATQMVFANAGGTPYASPLFSFACSPSPCSSPAPYYVQQTGITVTNNGSEAVYGTGTNNFLSKWNTGGCNTGLTSSVVFDDGTNVGIGTTSPNTKLEVSGVARLTTNTSSHLQLGALNSGDNFAYISSASQTNGTGLKFATTSGSGTNTAAVQMTILNNGNIGIGTNSPNFKVQLASGSIFVPAVNSPTSGNIYLGGETNAGNTGMRLWGNATGLAGGGIDIKSNLGFIIRMDNTDGSTERVRINANNGYFGINSNPTAVLHVKGTNTTPEFFLEPSSWNASGQTATLKMGDANHYIRSEYGVGMSFYDMNRFCFQNAPVIISGSSGNCAPETGMVFTVRGDAWSSGVKWYTSDKRYKKEIKVIENAAEKLSKISGYTYQYDTEKFPDMSFSKGTQAGILAQELKEVLPEAVRLNDKGYYSVNYNAIIPLLIEAVKEQNKKVSGKDEVINQLKSEVSSLESRLHKLEQALAGNNNGGTEKGNLLLKDVPVLEQNTPNPFSTSTTVKYFVPNMKNSAEIDVYDSKGIRINSYAIKVAGNGEITIKTQDLAPGNYFYELVIDGQKIASRKMILVH